MEHLLAGSSGTYDLCWIVLFPVACRASLYKIEPMHLKTVVIENFGPIARVELDLDDHFNVIAGVNGAGKSTILNAIWVMLSRYISAVRTGRAATPFPNGHIRKGAKELRVAMEACHNGETFRWTGGRRRIISKVAEPLTSSRELVAFAFGLAERLENDPRASIPIVAAFSVNRAVLDIPLRLRGKAPSEQLNALDDAAAATNRNFRQFFGWFRDREDLENEMRLRDPRHRDPQLQAVRLAVEGLLPGFSGLRVRRSPLRMVLEKNGQEFEVNQLSDGEKSVVALAGDLARRLAVANPGKKKPLAGDGIVLIDELELHLHPKWQREVVQRLQETFPHCQFIVTSHSPQVLSASRPNQVYLLKDGEANQPLQSYGREVGLILEELMDTPARPSWIAEKLTELYDQIDEEEYAAAQKSFDDLAETIGRNDPGLTAARSVLKPKARSLG